MFASLPLKHFLSVFLCFAFLGAEAQQLSLRSHPMNQVLDIPTIYHSIQDSYGFRWFGTETGAVRFDGKTYRRFTMEDGLMDNEVLRIFEDSKKRIWFLTFNGHLSFYYKGKFYNESNSVLIKKIGLLPAINAELEDQKGGLYFSDTHSRIVYIGPENQVEQYTIPKSHFSKQLPGLYEDTRGQVYLVCTSGFYRFDKGQLRPACFRYHPNRIKSSYAPAPGQFYFLAEEGLVFMQDTRQQLLIPRQQLPQDKTFDLLFVDSHQRLWLLDVNDGMYMLENIARPQAGFKLYLKGNYISSISEDREKNLWFCTTGSGTHILPASVANTVAITQAEGLPENKINSLAKDSRGNIWIGMDKAKVARYRQGQIQAFDLGSKTYNRVTYLLADKQDNIWCGTDWGMIELENQGNGRYRQLERPFHIDKRKFSVKSIDLDQAGNITFAHAAGIERFRDKARSDGYLTDGIFPVERTRTYTHFFDQQGQLWYSNVKGVHQIGADSQQVYLGESTPELSYRLTSIKALPDGVLAMATYGQGILLVKEGKLLKHITKQEGLSSNICRKLFVDHETVWVATNEGLNRFRFSRGSISGMESFHTTDGLLTDQIMDVLVDQDLVYVATTQGLNIMPNKNLKQGQQAPPLELLAVTIAGQNIRNQASPQLKHFQNRIQFEFIGITFQDARNLFYRYRLKGSNHTWTTTQNSQLEFSALQPGSYTFEVRTRTQNSPWSKTLRYSFVIAPPFWQTWWFQTLLALLVLMLAGIGIRIYVVFKVRQKVHRLETENQLQQERERIARDLHDNVGSHLAYIINSLEELPGQDQPAMAYTRTLREYTKQTITQLRHTIWAIRQENISLGELEAKIKKLIWEISHLLQDFRYEVGCEGDKKMKLTPVQALNLFRIAQEAINNVLKHSNSLNVTVNLRVLPLGHLEMLIADQGQGFDVEAYMSEGHYGLRNMQERAKEMDAFFKISSYPGEGTMVYLKVRLKKGPEQGSAENKVFQAVKSKLSTGGQP